MISRPLIDEFKFVFEGQAAHEAMRALCQAAAEVILDAPDDQCGMWLMGIYGAGLRAVQTVAGVPDERLARAIAFEEEEARKDVTGKN